MREKTLIAAYMHKIILYQLDFTARGMFLFSFRLSSCTGDPAGLQPPPLSAPSFGKEGKQI